jgi:hypothetical protein
MYDDLNDLDFEADPNNVYGTDEEFAALAEKTLATWFDSKRKNIDDETHTDSAMGCYSEAIRRGRPELYDEAWRKANA